MALSLSITTVFGNQVETEDAGPFLLAAVQGVEGISIPFSFDLTLYRRTDFIDVNPTEFIGTRAAIGILDTEGDSNQVLRMRCGVIETMEKAGTNEQVSTGQTNLLIYRARLVPAIKMLDYEQVFRVFENMTVLDILEEVLQDLPGIDFKDYLQPRFGDDTFPKIDYCVQFHETTFAFVQRLLAEFGIWYTFEHPGPHDTTREVMVLGRTPFGFKFCEKPDMVITYKDLDDGLIADFRRGYQVGHNKVRVGDYSLLTPRTPAKGDAVSSADFEVYPGDLNTTNKIELQIFPGGMPQEDSVGDNHALDTSARNHLSNEEARVFVAQGQTKNKTLRAGSRFTTKDGTAANNKKAPPKDSPFGPRAAGEYLVTRLSISAFERAAGHHTGTDLINLINPYHWWQKSGSSDSDRGLNLSTVVAGAGMTNWLQDEAKYIVDHRQKINNVASFLSGPAGLLANFLQIAVSGFKELFDAHDDDYGNSFVAVPWEGDPSHKRLPLPLAVSVRADGPQLAVVIGPHGLDVDNSDIHADSLGRVRVRFPWHTNLPDPGEADPLKTDRRTAWIRVSQSWAGNGMGSQFLPRIGDEVIVSYLDGDPARPVITGRLYNASDGGMPGLPFPPDRGKAKPITAKDVHTPSLAGTLLRSGWRTRSSPKPKGQKDRFNMIRFDDAWKDEQLLLRSQGRTDVTSFGPWHDTSHGNRHIRVGGKDPDTGKGGGALLVTTGDEYDQHVGADRFEGVDKKYQLSVKSDTVLDLQGDCATIVGGTSETNAKTLVIEASTKITLKVGSSFVVLTPAGVFVKGAMVQINSGGAPDSTSNKDVTDPLEAGTADPGDPPDWLAQHPPGQGGARSHHTAVAKHGLLVTMNADKTLQLANGIKVAGDPSYQDKVVTQLAVINDTPTGKQMLDDYGRTGKSTTIQPRDPPPGRPNATTQPTDPVAAQNGTGSDSVVKYDPDQWPAARAPDVPGDVVLMHELTHAQHNAHGQRDLTPKGDNWDNNEEFNTIQQENKYRSDRGIRNRTSHHSN
jgi:uncharacterized protein involved in type VI secretion and phage assembly